MCPAAYSDAGRTSSTTTRPRSQAGGELVGGDLIDPGPVTEVGVGEDVDVGDMGDGDITQRSPQLGDAFADQSVEDPLAVATGPQQPDRGKTTEMVGGVGHALADLSGDLLDRLLALGEQVDDLGPPTVAQRPGHRREGVEKLVLGLAATRCPPRNSN